MTKVMEVQGSSIKIEPHVTHNFAKDYIPTYTLTCNRIRCNQNFYWILPSEIYHPCTAFVNTLGRKFIVAKHFILELESNLA